MTTRTTKAAKTKPKAGGTALRPKAADTLQVESKPDEHHLKTLARLSLDPGVRHANLAMVFASGTFGDKHKLSIMDCTEVLAEWFAKAERGDKCLPSRLLAAQAASLDGIFTELARRSANNMGQYIDATDRYMRLALKAQAACRSTLEALARLHQPREQTVKHVHVNGGGQAVVADHIHQHTGGGENGKSDEQPHATGAAGASAALPSPDPLGNGVPVPGCEGAEAVPNARGEKSGRA